MAAQLKVYTDVGHTSEVAHTVTVSTTLHNGGTLSIGATTVPLTSTARMPAQGFVDIDTGGNLETLPYVSIAANTITLATPTTKSHSDGVLVVQWVYVLAVGDQTNGIPNDGTNYYPTNANTGTWYLYNAGDQDAATTTLAATTLTPSTTSGKIDTYVSVVSSTLGRTPSASIGTLTAGTVQQFWVIVEIPEGQSTANNPQLCILQASYTSLTTAIISDTFAGRTVASGFGTASDGVSTWAGPTAFCSVSGGEGLFTITTAPQFPFQYIGNVTVTNCDLTMRFSLSNTGDGVYFVLRGQDTALSNVYRVVFTAGSMFLQSLVAGVSTNLASSISAPLTANTFYHVRFRVSGTAISARYWTDGSSEPSTWNFQVTSATYTSGLVAVAANMNAANSNVQVDNLVVTNITTVSTTMQASFLIQQLTHATTNYYVDVVNGNDSNSGSQASPWATIQKAANTVAAGSTVNVLPGTYTQASSVTLTMNTSGTATARIKFVSTVKWGARIRGNATQYMWLNNGNYIDIIGFDISSANASQPFDIARIGVLNEGSFCRTMGCFIHDIAAYNNYPNGGAGIDNANYASSDNDMIGNWIFNIGNPASGYDSAGSVQGLYHSCLRGHILNNVAYGCSGYGIHLFHGAAQVIVTNNLAFNNALSNHAGGVVIGAQAGEGQGINDYTLFANNIVMYNVPSGSGSAGGISEIDTGTHNIYLNNVVYGNSNYTGTNSQLHLLNGNTAQNTLAVDPQLVNYESNGNGNYRLTSTSVCRNAGIFTGVGITDYDGNSRTNGAVPDIGPFEWEESLAVTTTTRDNFVTTKARG